MLHLKKIFRMIKNVNIAEIKPNDQNPRYISDSKFKKLVKSIKDFPEMLEVRRLVVDENMVVLGGNMRLKAIKSAGIFDVPIDQVTGWTEEQKKEFIIKDNLAFGEWDWDILANEWNTKILSDWGLEVWQNQDDQVIDVNGGDEYSEWVGMPDFEEKEQPYSLSIQFLTDRDRDEFVEKYKIEIGKKKDRAWSTTYPFEKRKDLNSISYE